MLHTSSDFAFFDVTCYSHCSPYCVYLTMMSPIVTLSPIVTILSGVVQHNLSEIEIHCLKHIYSDSQSCKKTHRRANKHAFIGIH